MSTNLKLWIHGLAGAFIGAFGTAISNVLVDPSTYNLQTLAGAKKLLLSSLISAGLAVGLYLKSSPVPALDQKKVSE